MVRIEAESLVSFPLYELRLIITHQNHILIFLKETSQQIASSTKSWKIFNDHSIYLSFIFIIL